tara:strand:+ start:649 stop:1260 length:612 start_codon:yes stop_codon:yes gene_type:complete
MALYVTDGTTARTTDPGIVWGQGNVQSATAYVNFEYGTARTAGYGLFNLQLTNLDVTGYEARLTPLQNSSSVETDGCYGGVFAHGEGDADLDAGTSGNFNNYRGFPLTAKRNGEESGNNYLGNYSIWISDPTVAPTGTDFAGYPSVWWQGTHRLSTILAANVQGGGVNNQWTSHWGIRLESNDPTNNRIQSVTWKLMAYKNGT